MGLGYLKIQASTGDGALPVEGAKVIIKDDTGNVIYQLTTDENGKTEEVSLFAPDKNHTLDPNDSGPFYSLFEVHVIYEKKYITKIIKGVQVFDTIHTILPVSMLPLPEGSPQLVEVIEIPPPAIQDTTPRHQINGTDMLPTFTQPGTSMNEMPSQITPFALREVVIPDYITVHLGAPTAYARNVRVKFADYIKNVASSEIYPTWPQSSLEANIYAQISFALNRVFTEWYRSRGFNFDITSSTAVDQAFVDGREIFENISVIVDNIFNSFIRRPGRLEPFFAQFCSGTTVTCPGLSQWGTVTLSNQGMTPIQILRRYYPNDVMIVTSNNIRRNN